MGMPEQDTKNLETGGKKGRRGEGERGRQERTKTESGSRR